MSASSLLRVAVRGPATFFRSAALARPAAQPMAARILASSSSFSTSARLRSEHQEETFEEFSARYGRKPRAGERELGPEELGTAPPTAPTARVRSRLPCKDSMANGASRAGTRRSLTVSRMSLSSRYGPSSSFLPR